MTIDPGFTTPSMAQIFTAERRVELFATVESALALAQATLGIIPQHAADEIVAACMEQHGDPAGVLVDGWEVGTPVLAFLDHLRVHICDEAKPWLHYGVTTQDIIDNAMMLQLQSAVEVLHAQAVGAGLALLHALEAFGDAPMMARSFLQPAEPSLFCLRAAHWLAPLAAAMNRLPTLSYVAQLGGPIGDQLSLDLPLATEFADRLGFVASPLAWHTNREPLIAIVQTIASLVRAAAKVASDLVFLAQSGDATMRAGGSTAMLHKRNPIDAIRCLAAADAFRAVAAIVTSARPHELERAAGSWHAEWFAVPLIAQTASAVLESLGRAIGSLVIHAADLDVPDDRRSAARSAARRAVESFDRRNLGEQLHSTYGSTEGEG